VPLCAKIFDAIETVGPTDATVLITSESGDGQGIGGAPRSIRPVRENFTLWSSFTVAR